MQREQEKKYIHAFNCTRKAGAQGLAKLSAHFSSLADAWRAPAAELVRAGLTQENAQMVADGRRSIDVEAFWEKFTASGIALVARHDAEYPKLLRTIIDAPYALYIRGTLPKDDEKLIAIVGTRKPTAYGKEAARYLARELVRAGFSVVSGMAIGLDAVALGAALEENGQAYGVLGCGVDVPYPAQNQPLARRVVEHGALISEFAPGVEGELFHFPMRNRIIAGMSLGTLVIEAREKSGTLITADLALDYNRDVFAVPGPMFSQVSRGTHKLIQNGAKLVQGVRDILETYGLEIVDIRKSLAEHATPDEQSVLAAISDMPMHLDEIIRASSLPVHAVHSALTMLEIKGAVEHVGSSVYGPKR